MITKVGVDFRF